LEGGLQDVVLQEPYDLSGVFWAPWSLFRVLPKAMAKSFRGVSTPYHYVKAGGVSLLSTCSPSYCAFLEQNGTSPSIVVRRGLSRIMASSFISTLSRMQFQVNLLSLIVTVPLNTVYDLDLSQ
jgi:hypothetical protein